MIEYTLWAIKEGAQDWEEELILSSTTDLNRVAQAKKWAIANGWKNLRVSEFKKATSEKEFFDQLKLF